MLDQARPGQHLEQAARLAGRFAGQRGHRVAVKIGAGVQAREPEEAGRRGVKLAEGPGERGPQVRRRIIAIGERVQAGAPRKVAGDLRQGQVRLHGGPGRDHRQRQRQARARADDLLGRGGVGGQPGGAQALFQQLAGFGVGEHVQHQRPGGLDRRQPGQLTSAGDDDPAGGRPGQQRPHLRGVARVVQQHQHPLAGQQAPVEAQLGLLGLGQLIGPDLQRVQQHANGIGRASRDARRVETAQVHIQLPVGELLGDLMRPLQRERGLPDPRGTADGRDHRGPAGMAEHLA